MFRILIISFGKLAIKVSRGWQGWREKLGENYGKSSDFTKNVSKPCEIISGDLDNLNFK